TVGWTRLTLVIGSVGRRVEDAVLVERRRLHDEYVADGVLHDVTWNRSQRLALARAQTTVADDDEVRRVRADRVEERLRRVSADEPLLDVACSLLDETGDGLLQGLASDLGTVQIAVQPFPGA